MSNAIATGEIARPSSFSKKTDPGPIFSLGNNEHIVDYVKQSAFHAFMLTFVTNTPSGMRLTVTSETLMDIFRNAHVKLDKARSIDVGTIITEMTSLRKSAHDQNCEYEESYEEFHGAITMIETYSNAQSAARLANGVASFQDLYLVMKRGTEIVVDSEHGLIGGTVDRYRVINSMMGTFGRVTISTIMALSTCRKYVKFNVNIPAYQGDTAINKLLVRPISKADKKSLTARGRIFERYTNGPIMCSYKGTLGIPTWIGENCLRADGRLMIDLGGFAQMEPDMYRTMSYRFDNDNDDYQAEPVNLPITDENAWHCYNRIPAFSMRLKRWGWVQVADLSPVVWRDDAFDQLVLPEDYKSKVYHLVKNYGNSYTDFIDGKSGGLVFLLHGPTGQGKTLTSEAVAEALHRPLYSVSMGELGTNPTDMEENLRQILDLAHRWNAVVLLDEADIFMEARDSNNVERNAMVSIFLRLLEYHSGVMFLTTNRVKSFDPAFFSRISLAIQYYPVDAEAREVIWTNILEAAKIDHTEIDIPALAAYKVNGRNVKTAVRLAQTIAFGLGRPVTHEDIEGMLDTMADFNKNMGI